MTYLDGQVPRRRKPSLAALSYAAFGSVTLGSGSSGKKFAFLIPNFSKRKRRKAPGPNDGVFFLQGVNLGVLQYFAFLISNFFK
jgi:hypothetical protein